MLLNWSWSWSWSYDFSLGRGLFLNILVLFPSLETIIHGQNLVFRLVEDTQAGQAVQCHINLSLGCPLIEAGDVLQAVSETGSSTNLQACVSCPNCILFLVFYVTGV